MTGRRRARKSPRRKPRRAGAHKTLPARVGGVAITKPDKIFWPAHGGRPAITKADYARYLARVAPRMLLHVANRPISLLRAPDGIRGGKFLQRHLQGGTAAPVLSLKTRGGAKPFLGVRNAQALIALAQAGALEIHPWGSRPNRPGNPDRIVIDLDPAPGLAFGRVVAAAKDVGALMRACGLVPFVKTTGGNGLHVVAPIKGGAGKPPSWTEARAFAKALCRELQRRAPRRYTTNPLRHARRGKMFLDYLRNARAASAVAPWSARAWAGAPIAVPLSWRQLRAGLDPSRFAIATSAPLLRAPDPWRNLSRAARALPKAMGRLESLAARKSGKTGRPKP